jgi:hypothetical protein
VKDELPDIAKRAARVAAVIESAVSRFARRHRYTTGADLRAAARQLVRCTYAAWHERSRKLQRVHELSKAVDDLKVEIQIADLIHAWGSRRELEAVGRLVTDFGGRVGGWLKKLHSMGQSAPGASRAQRAPILSARSASLEARA